MEAFAESLKESSEHEGRCACLIVYDGRGCARFSGGPIRFRTCRTWEQQHAGWWALSIILQQRCGEISFRAGCVHRPAETAPAERQHSQSISVGLPHESPHIHVGEARLDNIDLGGGLLQSELLFSQAADAGVGSALQPVKPAPLISLARRDLKLHRIRRFCHRLVRVQRMGTEPGTLFEKSCEPAASGIRQPDQW